MENPVVESGKNYEFTIRITDAEMTPDQVSSIEGAVKAAAADAITSMRLDMSLREQALDEPQLVRLGWETRGLVYRPEIMM